MKNMIIFAQRRTKKKNKMKVKLFMAVLALAATPSFAQLNSGLDKARMDLTKLPGTDFFEFASGGWMKSHPLPAQYGRYGQFEVLDEVNAKRIRSLVQDVASQKNAIGTDEQKIADLYKLGMDSVRQNKEGFLPVKADLRRIESVKKSSEILPLMAYLNKKGVQGYFGVRIGADDKNCMMNIVNINQGGLTLRQNNYYLDTDEHTAKVRDAYRKHITNLFKLAGFKEADALKKMESVMKLETRIAKASSSRIELRDPESNYHKMTVAQLKKDYADIDWNTLLSALDMSAAADVVVGQPKAIREIGRLIKDTPIDDQKNYFEYKLIVAASPFLTDAFRAENFDFDGRFMMGSKEDNPRWKQTVNTVQRVLGQGIGKLYVAKYFPAAHKERMEKLVENLRTALGQRIEAQEWMSEETKKNALDKLAHFGIMIGYPDKWTDYSKLTVNPKLSYWENMCVASEFNHNKQINEKLNKPVDRKEWHMMPQTVNASYNPTSNSICFPAGILQYPFFDMTADDAFNYGAIGVVIGHEMTHGFDDEGAQYDKDGNLKNWWADGDDAKFRARTKVMSDFFDATEVLPGLHANGKMTLGETLADHGGLQVAFQAYKNATKDAPLGEKDGFTADQRFFIAFATVWGQNINESELRRRTMVDEHAQGRWRVNCELPHCDMWYDAFHITEQDPMFIAKDKRVQIW